MATGKREQADPTRRRPPRASALADGLDGDNPIVVREDDEGWLEGRTILRPQRRLPGRVSNGQRLAG